MSAMAVDTLPANGAAANGDAAHEPAKGPKYASGLILPPPEIKCEHADICRFHFA